MSYSGYIRYLCKSGHLYSNDCYDTPDEEEWKCGYCGEPVVWSENIDTTNGYNELCGETQLEIVELPKYKICKECGHEEIVEPARYMIPHLFNIGDKVVYTSPEVYMSGPKKYHNLEVVEFKRSNNRWKYLVKDDEGEWMVWLEEEYFEKE